MGGRAGNGRRLVPGSGSSSMVSSAISNSRIRFTTLVGRKTAGLNISLLTRFSMGELLADSLREAEIPVRDVVHADAASRSRLDDPGVLGEKRGRVEMWLAGTEAMGVPAE